jgi:hypothetical protein
MFIHICLLLDHKEVAIAIRLNYKSEKKRKIPRFFIRFLPFYSRSSFAMSFFNPTNPPTAEQQKTAQRVMESCAAKTVFSGGAGMPVVYIL